MHADTTQVTQVVGKIVCMKSVGTKISMFFYIKMMPKIMPLGPGGQGARGPGL